MPSKVAIYIRVSTQEQAQEGYSIGAQTDRLTAYCKAKDWPLADIYTDAGFSGSNMQRPALQRLIDDAQNGVIDCVLVYKLDRLSRSQKDTLTIIEDILLANDVAFVSMSENFDTSSPLGRAMIGILSVFAQLEREQIRERMSLGKSERARSGLWHGGGFHPYGYDYIDGRLIPNELEAIAVREVYDLFLAGESFGNILQVLQNKYGAQRKYLTTVKSILSNRLYLGEISWRGQVSKGQHEPLIDEITFQRAQALLNSKTRLLESKPVPFKSTSLFGNILRCSVCGNVYGTRGNHSGHAGNMVYRPYYVCKTKIKSSKTGTVCLSHNYPRDELDAKLQGEINRLIEEPHLVTEIASRPKKKKRDTTASRRAAVMKKIDEIDRQLSRVVDLYQLGSISMTEIGERTKKLQEEKSKLQAYLSDLKQEPQAELLSIKEVRSILSQYAVTLDSAGRRPLIRQLIREIIVLPEKGNFEILWNF